MLYSPADEADLSYFMASTPLEIPVTVIGLGSNLLVRDGGIGGVVIRLGKGFGDIKIEPESRLRAGAAVPDVKVARAAAEAGIAGLSFYRGIPGCVGGALRMNGGAHGRETCEVVVEARAVDREGNVHVLPVADLATPIAIAARPRTSSSPRRCSRASPAIPPRSSPRWTTSPPIARGAADQEPHRRLDLQEPAGQQGLAAHRRRGVPGTSRRRRPCLRDALQLPHQRGQRRPAPISRSLARRCARGSRETSGIELEWEIKRLGVARDVIALECVAACLPPPWEEGREGVN